MPSTDEDDKFIVDILALLTICATIMLITSLAMTFFGPPEHQEHFYKITLHDGFVFLVDTSDGCWISDKRQMLAYKSLLCGPVSAENADYISKIEKL